jgi:hypothetical protein
MDIEGTRSVRLLCRKLRRGAIERAATVEVAVEVDWRDVLCADSEDVARMQSRVQQRVSGRCVVGPACAAAEKERERMSPLAATCGPRK